MATHNEQVQLLYFDTGLLCPHYQEKKALSANTLTKILREIEYKEIPQFILLKAAQRGKSFHKTIQEFVATGTYPTFVDMVAKTNLSNLDQKVYETINFLKKGNSLEISPFLGSEKLHYAFYKGELLGTYLDLEFQDYIVELKTNSLKVNDSPLALLIFEMQLLIQHLCTGKNTYLL